MGKAGAKPGHPVTPETRAKISAALKGKSNGREGWVMPAETRAKISEAHLRRKGDAVTKEAIHQFVKKRHPKTGRCEKCGKEAKTQYAFRHHPRPYTRNRADYLELCPLCHWHMDRD